MGFQSCWRALQARRVRPWWDLNRSDDLAPRTQQRKLLLDCWQQVKARGGRGSRATLGVVSKLMQRARRFEGDLQNRVLSEVGGQIMPCRSPCLGHSLPLVG